MDPELNNPSDNSPNRYTRPNPQEQPDQWLHLLCRLLYLPGPCFFSEHPEAGRTDVESMSSYLPPSYNPSYKIPTINFNP